MKAKEMEKIAGWINAAIEGRSDDKALAKIRREVETLCKKFPLYRHRLKRG
jgi:glycine hydroxymethyltransferase